METIGLPRDMHDGSGRGEKPAQKVKPLTVGGVRLDMEQEYFYNLMIRFWQGQTMENIEKKTLKSIGIPTDRALNSEERQSVKELMDSLATNFDIDEMPGAEQAPNNPLETETYTETDDEMDDDSKTDDDGTEDESDELECVDGNEPSASEKAGMLKKKAMHRFRTERHLTEATAEGRPIAGFIEHLSAVDSQKKSQT